MKKYNVIALICLFSILFYDCGIKITYVNSNITESSNQVTTQKPNASVVSHQTTTHVTSNADKTYQVTTQKPNTTLDTYWWFNSTWLFSRCWDSCN